MNKRVLCAILPEVWIIKFCWNSWVLYEFKCRSMWNSFTLKRLGLSLTNAKGDECCIKQFHLIRGVLLISLILSKSESSVMISDMFLSIAQDRWIESLVFKLYFYWITWLLLISSSSTVINIKNGKLMNFLSTLIESVFPGVLSTKYETSSQVNVEV